MPRNENKAPYHVVCQPAQIQRYYDVRGYNSEDCLSASLYRDPKTHRNTIELHFVGHTDFWSWKRNDNSEDPNFPCRWILEEVQPNDETADDYDYEDGVIEPNADVENDIDPGDEDPGQSDAVAPASASISAQDVAAVA